MARERGLGYPIFRQRWCRSRTAWRSQPARRSLASTPQSKEPLCSAPYVSGFSVPQ